MMFCYPDRDDGEEEATSRERRRHGFSDFVDKTLALLSNSARIKKFSLECEKEKDKSRINRWIRTALERGCLELNVESGRLLRIDSELFTSKTLVKLKMSDDVYPVGRLSCGDVHGDDGPLENEIYGDVTSLIEGMKNIKSLHLSPDSLDVLNNLLTLSIESDKEKVWQAIPRLLNSSPNLQTLVIKGLVHRVTDWCGDACACIDMEDRERVCCLSRCRVKLLEISGYGGSIGELKQMRHFLGKLECLETVKIGVEEDINNSNYLRANLMALPRVSSKCKIQFI